MRLFGSVYFFGQEKLQIEIDNPEPRVGQRVLFSIKTDFLTDFLKKELGSDVELTQSTSLFEGHADDFERVILFKEAKTYKIGPFDFEYDDKQYTTNSIIVNVQPELPFVDGVC